MSPGVAVTSSWLTSVFLIVGSRKNVDGRRRNLGELCRIQRPNPRHPVNRQQQQRRHADMRSRWPSRHDMRPFLPSQYCVYPWKSHVLTLSLLGTRIKFAWLPFSYCSVLAGYKMLTSRLWPLTFWPMASNLFHELLVTWATFSSILSFLELFRSWVRGRYGIDLQTDAVQSVMRPPEDRIMNESRQRSIWSSDTLDKFKQL